MYTFLLVLKEKFYYKYKILTLQDICAIIPSTNVLMSHHVVLGNYRILDGQIAIISHRLEALLYSNTNSKKNINFVIPITGEWKMTR